MEATNEQPQMEQEPTGKLYGYYSGIEDEEQSDNELEADPFDPDEISIDPKVITMETYLRRLIQHTIKLNPDFQRAEVWDAVRKSQLIESLMLKIPLPMFYVSADEKGNYTVVDGLQRLSTIRDFVLGDAYMSSYNTQTGIYDENKRGLGFRLSGLEFWKDYNGRNYAELPVNIRNRIIESEFRFTVINPGTPELVRRNIFKRINTGGMPLSGQEIRNALYLGRATKLLNRLASLPQFRQATGGSIHGNRMEDRELILRFVAFLIRDYTTYRKTVTIDSYLSDTMIILNAMPDLASKDFKKIQKASNIQLSDIKIMADDEIVERFITAMTWARNIFGDHAFRKSFQIDRRRTPINAALFETWGVILGNMNAATFDHLITNKGAFLADCRQLTQSYYFLNAISRASMLVPSVKTRFEGFNLIVNKYAL
ncbi:DUF262 domain-containing protein [Rurimicrobium arvi]|uniref:DUF262 domain-containing protein n=1 Tax=Rurimicrobium arvi TaxID=2049916 RepID=A0ABP8MY49_9BACT